MATIKVTDGEGFVNINGKMVVKGTFRIKPFPNGQIRLGPESEPIAVGMFSDFLDTEDQPFSSQALAMTFLQICM